MSSDQTSATTTAGRGADAPPAAMPQWLAAVDTVPDPCKSGAVLLLRRSWPRDAAHVLLEYVDANAERVVVGQWMSDGRRLRRVAAASIAAGGPDAATLLASRGVVLHGHGADRRLAGLGRLLEEPAATLVVHRPERRAVVRIDAADGSAPRWAKVVRSDRVARLRHRAEHLTGLADAVPQLLHVDARRGLTEWTHLPGVTLGDLLDDDAVAGALRATGALLRRLHAIAPPGDPALRHRAEDELAVVTTWIGHLATFDPSTHRTAEPLLAPVAALLRAAPSRAHTTVHRDVHDGQLLVAGSRVTLLDPDTIAAGEPELDLGNLRAHLHLAALQGRGTRVGVQQQFDLVRDGYGADRIDPQRLHAYTAAALLRLVGVHAMRPHTRAALPRLLDEAQRTLLAPTPPTH